MNRMVIGVQPDVVPAHGRDHVPPPASFPEPRLFADDEHRSGDAIGREHLSDVAGNIIGIWVDDVLHVEANEYVHDGATPRFMSDRQSVPERLKSALALQFFGLNGA